MRTASLLGAVAATAGAVTAGVAGPLCLPAFAQTAAPAAAKQPMNILFIAVDDLRPSFGVYGGPIKTPNIDKLAARGTTFLRAYCQQAVCSPSRTSLLTGQRPDTTRVYDLVTHFRKNLPDAVTLPQYFKQNGYHAQGMGKIFHNGLDDKTSWSVPHQMLQKPTWGPEGMATQQRVTAAARAAGEDVTRILAPRGPAWESVDSVPDNYFQDGATADKAIETLGEMKAGSRPFFLAVGFSRPHLPFVAPKKYWDLYPPSDIKLPANYGEVPTDGVPIALTGWGELRAYADMPKQGPVSDEQAHSLIRGYYASASYMDAQGGARPPSPGSAGLDEEYARCLMGRPRMEFGGAWNVVQAHQLRGLRPCPADPFRSRSKASRHQNPRPHRVCRYLPHALRGRRSADPWRPGGKKRSRGHQ